MNVVSQYISVKRISDEIDFTCKPASKIRMAALVASITKKECKEISVFDSPDCNGEDRHVICVGDNKIPVTDNFSVEMIGVFDGHGGSEASEFLRRYSRDILAFRLSSPEPTELYRDILVIDDLECLRQALFTKLSNTTFQGELDRQQFIKNYVDSLQVQVCEHISSLNILRRDPGSTLSMNINFIFNDKTYSYLVTVGDSPIFAVDELGTITHGRVHSNLDPVCVQEALEHHSDVEVLTELNRGFGRKKPITTIKVHDTNLVESVPASTFRHKTRGLSLNIPRSMGHEKWRGAMSHKPDIVPVHNIARVVVMSDGISDMIVNHKTFVENAVRHEWDAPTIGKIYADRWYQGWTMLWNGKKYETDDRGQPHRVAIKGSRVYLADDMTLISAEFT